MIIIRHMLIKRIKYKNEFLVQETIFHLKIQKYIQKSINELLFTD